jgi:hypothetical protein
VAQIDDRPGILRGPLTVGVNGVKLPHFAPPSMAISSKSKTQKPPVTTSEVQPGYEPRQDDCSIPASPFRSEQDAHNKSHGGTKAKVRTTVNSHIEWNFRAQLTFVNALITIAIFVNGYG